jgi:hypothetical protein
LRLPWSGVFLTPSLYIASTLTGQQLLLTTCYSSQDSLIRSASPHLRSATHSLLLHPYTETVCSHKSKPVCFF